MTDDNDGAKALKLEEIFNTEAAYIDSHPEQLVDILDGKILKRGNTWIYSNVLFQTGIIAGNMLNPLLNCLDDRITGLNKDKNCSEYYKYKFTMEGFINLSLSFFLSKLGISNPGIALIGKLSSDAFLNELKPSFKYAFANLPYLANYFTLSYGGCAIKYDKIVKNHPFGHSLILSVGLEVSKISYHLLYKAIDSSINSFCNYDQDLSGKIHYNNVTEDL